MRHAVIISWSALLLGAAQPATAQGLPDWSIAEMCAKESSPGQCALFEGRARNAVSGSWAFVADAVKTTCLGAVRSPLDQSWRLLASCFDTESAKAIDKRAVATVKTPAEPVPPPKAPAPPPAAQAPATPTPAVATPAEAPTPGAAPAPATPAPTEPPKVQ